jgi:integrase
MAVSKDTGSVYNGKTWRVRCYYKDWRGVRIRHEKRGFATRHEAVEYERNFLAKQTKDINMSFDSFVDIYLRDMKPQIKKSTYANKVKIIDKHIRPFFVNVSLAEINNTHILQWQNEILTLRDDDGKGYSATYLRSINNQLTAIFNHAVRYYDLPKNPCKAFKKMGKQHGPEMLFWTKDEYMKFIETMKRKPISYYAFQILYWTGIRCGELLALTRGDFDLEKRTLRINKTYQVVNGEAMTTSPKTEKSNRTIELPQFLCDEMADYFDSIYGLDNTSRIFPVSKSYLHHEMDRGAKEAGVKRIRIHDLRHSSCALLIELGYSPIQIAERLGHETVTITERYSHLYPSVQRMMADRLNDAFLTSEED